MSLVISCTLVTVAATTKVVNFKQITTRNDYKPKGVILLLLPQR